MPSRAPITFRTTIKAVKQEGKNTGGSRNVALALELIEMLLRKPGREAAGVGIEAVIHKSEAARARSEALGLANDLTAPPWLRWLHDSPVDRIGGGRA